MNDFLNFQSFHKSKVIIECPIYDDTNDFIYNKIAKTI